MTTPMIAAPPPHDIGPRQGSPGRGACGATSKPIRNDLGAAGRSICIRKKSKGGLPKSLPKKTQHTYPPQSAPVNTSRFVPRGHQGSPVTTAAKRPTVIPTPSPIREGVSYLAATKTFIPQLPAPPLLGAETNNSVHHIIDDHTKKEQPANQEDSNLKEAVAKEETWTTLDVVFFSVSFFLDQLLMLLCVFMLLARPYQIILTFCFSVFICHVLIKWEFTNTLPTYLFLIARCIWSYVTSPPYKVFFKPPEKAFAFLLVVAALIETLYYKLHQRREQKEEEQRLEQEQRLVQLAIKKKQQEEAKRKHELEMLWRMAQQNTLIRERVEEVDIGAGGGNTTIRYSSVNNHDDKKRQYHTQNEAEDVIARMRDQGLDTCRTLKSYYNPQYDRWFVGNGW